MPEMTKNIAVIITSYNYGQYLSAAIESVLNQSIPCEIIVVDDGSTDNTQAVALSYINKGVIYLYMPHSGKYGIARNFGISHTSAEYIVPLDADDELFPSFLEKTYTLASDGHEIVTVNSDCEVSGALDDSIYTGNQLLYCAMFTRELWGRVGGYDEDIPVSSVEDWCMWIKAHKSGANSINIPESLFKYTQHPGSLTSTNIATNGQVIDDWMRNKGYRV